MTYHRIYDFFVLSAAGCGIIGCFGAFDKEKPFKDPGAGVAVFFSLVLLYFYFVLRIFNESSLSMAGAAVIYYVFVVLYLLYVFGVIRRSDVK